MWESHFSCEKIVRMCTHINMLIAFIHEHYEINVHCPYSSICYLRYVRTLHGEWWGISSDRQWRFLFFLWCFVVILNCQILPLSCILSDDNMSIYWCVLRLAPCIRAEKIGCYLMLLFLAQYKADNHRFLSFQVD